MDKELLDKFYDRYSSMLNILVNFRQGMVRTGNPLLDIPPCPVCKDNVELSYCENECDWAKLIGEVCTKMGGEGAAGYKEFQSGIKQAISGLIKIVFKIEEEYKKIGENK